ncbi:hypothetical protein DNK47_01530 [Mycoplasma wenyonii]|uniref:Uncharacterized protein n=1 Tax=Mycoplasma wenyonii TaxID=65123 RepID=A0A328PJ19_9MOLU|nr:hypothetical protein [Mycoplasma wenyonii]RAO95073.1 hypothetical protein DNK47_01530 [Mycoplasma wenyonii]
MLWIYLSKNLFALEIKQEDFFFKFNSEKILHLKRVDFETVKNQLTQVSLFEEHSHFIFEEYTGSFTELSSLFEKISISANVLITKSLESKIYLPPKLISQLADKDYWQFEPSIMSKERYLTRLLERYKLKKISSNLLEVIKKEAMGSHIQLKGVLTQLKLVVKSKGELTEDLIRNLIEANDVVPQLKNKYLFLEWYIGGRIKDWVLFLRTVLFKKNSSGDTLLEFLKYLAYSLNYHFWNERNDLEVQKFIREFSFNFLVFIETEIFKIKSNLTSGVLFFFWKHRPLNKLQLAI